MIFTIKQKSRRVEQNSELKRGNYGRISSNGIYFWTRGIYSRGKTYKDLKRKRNSRRGLQGTVIHCFKILSHGGVILGGGVLQGTIPHLEFTIEVQSNNLTHHQTYSKKQEVSHQLVTYLHTIEGLGYRKISRKLNQWGIPTQRGKEWLP